MKINSEQSKFMFFNFAFWQYIFQSRIEILRAKLQLLLY